jgi:hypothetical protein
LFTSALRYAAIQVIHRQTPLSHLRLWQGWMWRRKLVTGADLLLS